MNIFKSFAKLPGMARSAVNSYAVSALLIIGVASASMLVRPHMAHAERGYSALVIDRNSGKTLYARNADAPRYPASLTKMMTLYVLFDLIEHDRIGYKTILRVTPNASAQQPSKLGLKAGSKITVYNAIRALVTKSANDVAVTIAENLAGTEAKFARIMTWKARQIGMKNSVFKNASGLPNSSQVTTARDMATLGERLMSDFPKHYSFFRTRYFAYKGRSYRNHNSLLFNFSGTDGIKTGYTRASGFNLVASVKRHGKHLIGVVMGGKSSGRRNAKMRSILARAFKKAAKGNRRPLRIADLDTRIPTPMIAKVKPDGVVPRANARHRPSSGRMALRAPIPQPVLRRPRPRPRQRVTPVRSQRTSLRSGRGAFHIQIGAFATMREAEASLVEVRRRLGNELNAHRALTMPFNLNPQKLYYRARFAGFTKKRASSLCNRVKAVQHDCIVMRAD